MGRPPDVYRGRVSLSIFCSFITLELRGKEKQRFGFFFFNDFFFGCLGWHVGDLSSPTRD